MQFHRRRGREPKRRRRRRKRYAPAHKHMLGLQSTASQGTHCDCTPLWHAPTHCTSSYSGGMACTKHLVCPPNGPSLFALVLAVPNKPACLSKKEELPPSPPHPRLHPNSHTPPRISLLASSSSLHFSISCCSLPPLKSLPGFARSYHTPCKQSIPLLISVPAQSGSTCCPVAQDALLLLFCSIYLLHALVSATDSAHLFNDDHRQHFFCPVFVLFSPRTQTGRSSQLQRVG